MTGIRASITARRTVELQRFEVPEPSPDQLLLQVERTVISTGTELANYTGLEPDTQVPGAWCCYPWTPGYGGVGRVLQAGANVQGFSEGDRVFGLLNHASHALLDPSRQLCVRVPEGLDPTLAAASRMACVAITAWHRSTLSLGDQVLVIGLGLVGNLAAQFYALHGHRVVGVDPSASRRALAERCGVCATLSPEEGRLKERLADLAGRRGFRVVVEAVGRSDLVLQSIGLVGAWGQVILLGTPRAAHAAEITPALREIHWRGIDVRGALEHIYPHRKSQETLGISFERNLEFIFEAAMDGRLKLRPLVSHVVPPPMLQSAYEGLLNHRDEYLGVVIDWDTKV